MWFLLRRVGLGGDPNSHLSAYAAVYASGSRMRWMAQICIEWRNAGCGLPPVREGLFPFRAKSRRGIASLGADSGETARAIKHYRRRNNVRETEPRCLNPAGDMPLSRQDAKMLLTPLRGQAYGFACSLQPFTCFLNRSVVQAAQRLRGLETKTKQGVAEFRLKRTTKI